MMADAYQSSRHINAVTYNMHGINQGSAMLLNLSLSFDVIFCQEHWLLSDQLYRLTDMMDDFRCLSVSVMDNVCSKGVLKGHLFGGLAAFVRSSLCNTSQCLVK